MSSLALAGMGKRQLYIFRHRLAAFGKFFGDHVEHVLKFVLRLVGCLPDGMTAVNRWHVGNVASVVIAPTNHLIVE